MSSIRKLLAQGLAALFLVALPSAASADCAFKTGDFISELGDLNSVRSLEIEHLEYRKWAKNGIMILKSGDRVIRPRYKRKFGARVIVNYDFGRCVYPADVRQSGDFNDHIALSDGGLVQSLDVRMRQGNIAGTVRFKLFLKHTRNSENEIFAALLLRKLGFLAPRTRSVLVSQNERQIAMLFQEKEAKEFLEGQNRREGPILEGDERLYWGKKDYENGELEHLIQARMVNENWAGKGPVSLRIALGAYSRLQSAYTRYANRFRAGGEERSVMVLPDARGVNRDRLAEYVALVIAMNGAHSLRSHNRKYYWNVFLQAFEPIYYDGDIEIGPLTDQDQFVGREDAALILEMLDPASREAVKARARDTLDDAFSLEFARAAEMSDEEGRAFVEKAARHIARNIDELPQVLGELVGTEPPPARIDGGAERDQFIGRYLDVFPDAIFLDVAGIDPADGTTSVVCLHNPDCGIETRSLEEMALLLERRARENGRFVALLPLDRSAEQSGKVRTTRLTSGISVRHPGGASVSVDPETGSISLVQGRPDDWFLFLDQDLGGSMIEMTGLAAPEGGSVAAQRFNEFGLTGCVNVVNSRVQGTAFSVTGGACEDSLNIVASSGAIETVRVRNAYSDGVDLDFSTLHIAQADIAGAGNDCIDVSAGTYEIGDARFSECGDKGLSVGERSVVQAESVQVDAALIGVTSKDSSRVTVTSARMTGVPTCLEAYRKKQEFDGALLAVGELSCPDGAQVSDDQSTITLGGV